jgi:plasmid maintenance system antidote protein VapI
MAISRFERVILQLRLSHYFGTSERFWMNLQTGYDLEIEKDRLGDRLSKEIQARVGG